MSSDCDSESGQAASTQPHALAPSLTLPTAFPLPHFTPFLNPRGLLPSLSALPPGEPEPLNNSAVPHRLWGTPGQAPTALALQQAPAAAHKPGHQFFLHPGARQGGQAQRQRHSLGQEGDNILAKVRTCARLAVLGGAPACRKQDGMSMHEAHVCRNMAFNAAPLCWHFECISRAATSAAACTMTLPGPPGPQPTVWAGLLSLCCFLW